MASVLDPASLFALQRHSAAIDMEIDATRLEAEREDSPEQSLTADYSPTASEEPISYACMPKKEHLDENLGFRLPDDYMEHAIDLKVDPGSPAESGDLSGELGPADLGLSSGAHGSASDLNAGNLTLWRFLLDLLLSGRHQEIIQWTSARGEFMLLQAEEVARLWGLRKNKNHRMTYDKLSRALRYYYQKNIIQKVHGHKFVYRFVSLPDGVLQTCRMALQDKLPFDLSVTSASAAAAGHSAFRSSVSSSLSLLGDPGLSPRSLLARCQSEALGLDLGADLKAEPHAIKVEQRSADSPTFSSPGAEGSASSGGGGGHAGGRLSPPCSLSAPEASPDSPGVPPSRHCRCHPACRQLLPERRSVSCQTGLPTPPGFPFPAATSPPAARTPAASSPPPGRPAEPPARPTERPQEGRTLQKGLHSLNMQKFAQCIQLQTTPSAREMISHLGLPSPRSTPAPPAGPVAPARHAHHSSTAPYPTKMRHSPPTPGPGPVLRNAHSNGAWSDDQQQQRARSVSPLNRNGGAASSGPTSGPSSGSAYRPPDLPAFPPYAKPPGGIFPPTPASMPPCPVSAPGSGGGANSFVWVPVHVNMLRLGQHMSAAAAAAAAAASATSPTHALKNFAFPSGGQ